MQELTDKLIGDQNKAPAVATEYGKLFITTLPQGADIILDNTRYDEKSDVLLSRIAAGKHQLKLIKGSIGAIQEISILHNQINRVEIKLKALTVKVNVESTPFGADVFVDTILKGKTPLSIPMTAGKHSLKLSRKGYFDAQQTLTLDPLKESSHNLNVSLKRSIELKLTITPGNADLSVDNKAISNPNASASMEESSSYSLQLPEGKHSISIKHPHVVRNLQKNITLSAKNPNVSQSYTLKLDPNYLSQLAYESNRSTWNIKWISSLSLALATSAYAYSETQNAQKASEDMNTEFAAMSSSSIYSEAQTHNQEAQKHKETLDQHNSNVQTGSMLSAALWGLTAWIWLDEPEAPAQNSVSLLPLIESKGQFKLVLNQKW